MKRFSITSKKFGKCIVLVDDADANLLRNRVYTLVGPDGQPAAIRSGVGRVPVFLAHDIAEPPPGHRVIHHNGNTLDNRRSNLVVVTYEQWTAYFVACGNDSRESQRTGEPCRVRRDAALRQIIESNKEAA